MRKNLINLCLCAIVVAGCGGSGGGGATAPTGKPAVRAVTLSGYQTQVAAAKYVLPLLVAGSPTGSGLHGLGARPPRPGSRSLAFDADLNLYFSIATAGPTWTMSFFTDAAGANSAGFAKITIENAATFDTAYLSYPNTLDLSMNITAGNLVSSGTGKVVFTDSSGSNTLTGVVDAPGKGIHAALNMTLDSSGHVGGSVTVTQNGLTAVVSGLTGLITSGFSGNASVTPGNLTGTATINLLQGTYQLNITGPGSLTSQGSVDANHNLVIDYNDGTSLTLSDALNQPAIGVGSNGGGGTSSYTLAAINGNPSTIAAVSSDGKMVGQIGTNPNSIPNYWTSPSAAPQAVTLDSGLTNIVVTGVNASGHLVGSGLDATTHLPVALYWSAFNQAPVHLATPALTLASFQNAQVFLQSSDRIVVTFPVQGNPSHASYVYSGPADGSPFVIDGYVLGLSDGNAAVGVDAGNQYTVWANLAPGATSSPVPIPSGGDIQSIYMGLDGTIAASGTKGAWVVAGPGYTTTVSLKPPVAGALIGVFGVGPSGRALGFGTTDGNPLDNEGLIWESAASTPVILRTASTPAVMTANFETSSGILIVNCVNDPNGPTFRLSVMTPK